MKTMTDHHRTNSRPGDYPPSLAHPPSPLQAVARHPLLALLPVVLLIGAAIAVSSQRKPTYNAESRVAIGSFSPSEQSAPGAAYAGTQFASAYARAITAEDVVRPVARQTHLAPAQVSARLSATPVPDSPFLRIQATGPTAPAAEGLASAATGALTEYVRSTLGSGDIAVGAQARELAHAVLTSPLGLITWPTARVNRLLTIGLLPSGVREQYGFRWNARSATSLDAILRLVRGTRRALPRSIAWWPDARRQE